MPERIEITAERGEPRVVAIEGARVWLGSGEEAEVRVRAPGLARRHLCFVQTDHGYRVEPATPGATVEVNGEALFCKDLEAGDRITIAGLRLRWLASSGPAASPSPAPGRTRERRTQRAAAARSPRPSRSRRRAGWMPIVALFVVVVIGIGAVLRNLAGSTWPQSPQHFVDLARAQLRNRQPERALATLAFALRDATGPVREAALALEVEIRRDQVEKAAMPQIAVARQEHDLLISFEGRHLQGGTKRPAVRELLRQVDVWLARHAAVCEPHSEGQPLLQTVSNLRARYQALGGLGEPDTEADVLFAVQALLEFRWRDYKGALQRFDEFLRVHPDATAVQQAREQMLVDGEEWLRGKLRMLDWVLDRGDQANAELDLAQIERWCTLPQWQAMVQERRVRLNSGR